MSPENRTKTQFILDFFKDKPNQSLKLKEIDEGVRENYYNATGSRDIYINRTPRDLAKRGFISEIGGCIEKQSRGVFKFVPGPGKNIPKSPFSEKLKLEIKKNDNYQCSWCGKPETEDEILAVDHIIPEDIGGQGVFDNGTTLCVQCNNTKRNLGVASFGLKMFQKYLKISKKNNDKRSIAFLTDILATFKDHKIIK